MTDHELMQQALEALELLARCEHPLTKIQVRKPRDGGSIVTVYPHQVATDAAEPLRERLEQPIIKNYLEKDNLEPQRTHWEGCEEVHPECRQPEQEPVAWVTGWHDGHCVIRAANPSVILPIGIALYTNPPRREWVGLTDEEKSELDAEYGDDTLAHLDAIEAKLREKNT